MFQKESTLKPTLPLIPYILSYLKQIILLMEVLLHKIL